MRTSQKGIYLPGYLAIMRLMSHVGGATQGCCGLVPWGKPGITLLFPPASLVRNYSHIYLCNTPHAPPLKRSQNGSDPSTFATTFLCLSAQPSHGYRVSLFPAENADADAAVLDVPSAMFIDIYIYDQSREKQKHLTNAAATQHTQLGTLEGHKSRAGATPAPHARMCANARVYTSNVHLFRSSRRNTTGASLFQYISEPDPPKVSSKSRPAGGSQKKPGLLTPLGVTHIQQLHGQVEVFKFTSMLRVFLYHK